jgi:hypothetical protein
MNLSGYLWIGHPVTEETKNVGFNIRQNHTAISAFLKNRFHLW